MKYLITGGLGFIGSYFAEKLSQYSGNEITIIDNLSGASQQGHRSRGVAARVTQQGRRSKGVAARVS